MQKFHLIIIVFFLFIAGCAQKIPKNVDINPHWRTLIDEQKTWQVRGRIAFISPKSRQSAQFNWHYKNNKQHLILSSFMGTQILELTESDTFSKLTYDNQHYFGDNSTELVQRLTGFNLPIEQASKWLTATLQNPSNALDEKGRTVSSDWVDGQGNQWQASYSQFKQVNGMWLPSRINLVNQELTLKFKLNNWQF